MARRNTHFRRRFNASGPLERVLILIVLAVAIGVTIGLLLPQVSSDAAKITGGYTATGSAADTLNALAVDDNQSSSGYDRDSFGFRTTDVDGNGCDVRDDVLARDLTDITYKYAGSCVVESGTLADPYTAQTIHFVRGRATSAKVQIDHVVALENAWQSGARDWSTAKRHEFGNDPYNLLAVDGPGQSGEGFGFRRLLATHQRRLPLRLRGPPDWRQRQVPAHRHLPRKGRHARRPPHLPRPGRARRPVRGRVSRLREVH